MSWGVAPRNGVGLGVGAVPSIQNAPPFAAVKFLFAETGVLDSRITFTRASSGTYFDSTGTLKTATTDVARFDYNPSTLAARGLLIEEARTNLIANSEVFPAGTGLTITANSTVAPDGATTADTIVDTTANSEHYGDSTIAATSGVAYTFSAFIKQNGAATSKYAYLRLATSLSAYIIIDLSNMTVNTTGGANLISGSIQTCASGWYRVSVSGTANATGNVTCRIGTLGTSVSFSPYVGDGSGFIAWGRQFEAGAFATSYIATAGATAARAADVASVTGANFSSWFNQTEGTLLTTTLAFNQTLGSNRYVSTMDDGSTNNMIAAYIATDLKAYSFVVNGGAAVYQEIITTASNTAINKIAVAYKLNDFMSAANGAAGIVDTSGAVPVVNKITFGNRTDGARNLNGWVQSFVYYPKRLSNSKLIALTV